MLEIDKIQERFPERARDILKAFAQDFSKAAVKTDIPPNPPPPFASEPVKELFDPPVKTKKPS